MLFTRIAFLLSFLFSQLLLATNVLFVAASPVQPGKFLQLKKAAQKHDITIESYFAEKLDSATDEKLFEKADFVFFDTPREHIEDFVKGKIPKAISALAKSKKPYMWMRTKNSSGENLSKQNIEKLHAYYVNGGSANYDNFFKALHFLAKNESIDKLPPPIIFPESAIYYPGGEKIVFETLPEYIKYRNVSIGTKPIVAISIHQQYVSAEQTAFVDDLIKKIEANGALAVAVYTPVMDNQAITKILSIDGRVVANVLINTQIMLNPQGRKKEFEAMGIPVIQAMPYRKGDEQAWLADPQGVSLMDVPFYLSQAEFAGVADIQIAAATRKSDEQMVSISYQADAVVNKALNLIKLQTFANQDKRIAIFFYNYPPGEKNLSASFLNVPRSLIETLTVLKNEGYDTYGLAEDELIKKLQRLLAPSYRSGLLDALLSDDLAELYPVKKYEAWLNTLSTNVKNDLLRQGRVAESPMVITKNGEKYFVVPRLKLGKTVILPQPSRSYALDDASAKEKALYHNTKEPPSHFYMAVYLWAKESMAANAIVHYGTHGSQEWLPGKERGLGVYDYPMLAVGDVPVIYPYIVDNIGEALQTKRRGRATVISHQTPPFVPAGLHERLTVIHDELHSWLAQDEGNVKDKIKESIIQKVITEKIDKDMGVTDEQMKKDFPSFIDNLHMHLHEIAKSAQPLGLHVFGKSAEEKYRIGNLIMMTGNTFWESIEDNQDEADEVFVADYKKLESSKPYRIIKEYVVDGKSLDGLDSNLSQKIQKLKEQYGLLDAKSESLSLLAALVGRYIPTSYGGDPIKNPDALPTGRNLYGFDPSKIPTKASWEAGKEAMNNLLNEHKKQKGTYPKKLTFTLWSVETMRHQGVLEAQAMYAMGVEPIWDEGGRVVDVRLIDRDKLGRARVDVVLSATGLYRDHFPNTMKNLAKAAKIASEANETDNSIYVNAKNIEKKLLKMGMSAKEAENASKTRIFSSESGRYGTGLDDATLATDTWKGKKEGDAKLAELYLSRMQFAYGPDEAEWGKNGKGVNLYAEHLKGTEGAVLSRTSNLYGMLTTDDPFQYLGGISLAVKHLDGKAPELYISNLRGGGSGRPESAAKFLAKELATRNFHPGYIEGLMKEGYSGTLQVLDGVNNFWGWQATAGEIVRDDQWQEFVDVYVKDKHNLGLKKWFENNNPHALAQSIERMLEAARQGYWKADAKTVDELKKTYKELASKYDVKTNNTEFEKFTGMKTVSKGYGLDTSKVLQNAQSPKTQSENKAQPESKAESIEQSNAVRGIKLEKVEDKKSADDYDRSVYYGVALALLSFLSGGVNAYRRKY